MASQDPLYCWKKHSGFKKGLLTDIVLGDQPTSHGQYETTMHTEYSQKSLSENQKFAGRSSGFVISDKGQKHINFGDEKIGDQCESVTDIDFKAPVIQNETKDSKKITIQAKYHAKPETITSAAHVGSQTRKDLPLDYNFFRNFNTTTQDAFKTSPKDITPRTIYGARPSKLHFGDLSRTNNYATIHDTSFVPYYVEPFSAHTMRDRQTVIYNTSVTEAERENHYTTTVSDAYRGFSTRTEDSKYKPGVSQKNGTSHIQFGQSDASKTELSVTKSDYKEKKLESQFSCEKPSKFGMQKAIQPGDSQSILSFSQSVYKAEQPKADLPSAGFSHGFDQRNPVGISSVPSGDARFYDISSSKTTSKGDFVKYPWTGFPSFPALGAKITKSKVFSGIQADYVPNYTTTTQQEFVSYDPEDAKLTRGVPISPYSITHKLGSDELMETNTTQHAHFVNPAQICKRTPILPHIAHPNRLFPLTNGGHKFETTMEEYFGNRNVLYNSKSGAAV